MEKHCDENVNVNSHKRFSFAYKDSMCQAGVDSLTRNWKDYSSINKFPRIIFKLKMSSTHVTELSLNRDRKNVL